MTTTRIAAVMAAGHDWSTVRRRYRVLAVAAGVLGADRFEEVPA